MHAGSGSAFIDRKERTVQRRRSIWDGPSHLPDNPAHSGPRENLGGRIGRLTVIPVMIALTVFQVACNDTRIRYLELRDREAELAAAVEPVPVNTAALPLTDLQPYTVGPGDVLTLTLIGLQDEYSQLTLQSRVRDDGMLALPLVGLVKVSGLGLQGVERAVYDAHVPRFTKSLSVYAELSGPELTTVVVVGAAGEPGLVALRSNQRNPLYAVALSGGFFSGASGRVIVKPIRTEAEEVAYNLLDVNDLRRVLNAPPLQSGDMVTIESAGASVVYVTGLVNLPQAIIVPREGSISLARAVAAAGGLRDFLDPPEATLWRRLSNGEQVRVKIELDKLMNGEIEDVQLCAGDILDVPHTIETRAREWFAANIRLGPFGVTGMYDPVADQRARILANDDNDQYFRRAILQSLGTGVPQLLIPPVQTP